MVAVIVQLHRSLARNRMSAGKAAQVAVGATVGFTLAASTVGLVLLDVPAAARLDLIAIALGLWLVGWLVAPSFTGGPELTGQYFRLHPIPRTTLAGGLFAAAWSGLPAMVALVAFGVLVAIAVPLGPPAVAVAILTAVLSVAVLILAARLAAIWFAAVSRARLGAAISSTVTAAIIVAAQHSWILIVAVVVHLDTGLPGGLGTALGALPSSWGLAAVAAAGAGDWAVAAGAVLGLAALGAVLFLAWTRVVTAAPLRAAVVRAPSRRRSAPMGTTRKELLSWRRSPLRLQDVVLAVAYAVGTCALPLVLDFPGMLPFLGVAAVIMGVATCSNLYGADGTALWMTLAVPGAERAEVRGRQLAWLIVFGGVGAVLTAAGLLLHPDPVLLPCAVGAFLAVLGAGAGLLVLLSVYALVPGRDPHTAKYSPADQGDETGPAFLAIFLTLALAAPTIGVLLAGQLTGNDTLRWAGVAVGALTAQLAPVLLGSAAARRLAARGPELLHRMRSGPAAGATVRAVEPSTLAQIRTAWSAEEAGAAESAEPDAATKGVSGFEAMRTGEALLFWALYVGAILATVPQGLVAAGHLLAGSDATTWFVALRAPEHLQWPAVAGFIVLGVLLAAAATWIYARARRRVRRERGPE